MAKSGTEVTVKVYIEKLDKLVHHEKNPRFIKGKRHQELLQSLKEFPEMKLLREIVVDENLNILAGDKRAYALEELGYTDVTIKQVFGLTDKQKREFIIKDNVHSGEWDTDIIANEWDTAELEKWGVPSFKFGDADDKDNNDDQESREVTCPDCGAVFTP